jgi:MFS family permease
METLDATIVTTALPAMAQSLGESTLDLTASVTVYLVAMTVFVPTAGWASERFGARNLFAGAIAVFTLASLLCGAAPTFGALLAARLLQGMAAAFMSPVGRLIVLTETPKERIIEAIGLIVWPGLIAPVIGPCARRLHRDVRDVALDLLRQYPARPHRRVSRAALRAAACTRRRTRFDARGFLLTAAALGMLIYGLSLVAAAAATS